MKKGLKKPQQTNVDTAHHKHEERFLQISSIRSNPSPHHAVLKETGKTELNWGHVILAMRSLNLFQDTVSLRCDEKALIVFLFTWAFGFGYL